MHLDNSRQVKNLALNTLYYPALKMILIFKL
jgi:hypothetical protein